MAFPLLVIFVGFRYLFDKISAALNKKDKRIQQPERPLAY